MSVGATTTSQVAVLGARGRVSSAGTRARADRPLITLASFGGLALYGTLRWSTLVAGGDLARLLGLFAMAMLLAGGRPALARRSRLAAAAATLLALVAVLPLAGVPLDWVVNLRIAVTARAIGDGLSALPQVLVPYSGINPSVQLVIVLGAGVLLFDGALLVAFAPRVMEDARRFGAALPLVALAAVPTTLVHPAFPYLDGALLFVLLVAFLWGEQIGRRRIGGALTLGLLAVLAAMVAAPWLDPHVPWVNYRALGGGFGPTTIDSFDWSQGYGPVDWPRRGRVVLEVAASRPEYWKAENLDMFDGAGWTPVAGAGSRSIPRLSTRTVNRWSQTVQVTIRDMETQQVIAAGSSQRPEISGIAAGLSPGTWTAGANLGPGDSYRVRVYTPHPRTAELDAAGADYAGLPPAYLTLELAPSPGTPSPDSQWLPGEKVTGSQPELVFPAFHSGHPIQSLAGPPHVSGASLITHAYPYARDYRLAQRLARGATTPYQFVLAVKRYLAYGYTYNENPPHSSYPLDSFLFTSKAGYCQQFAGAMALLLRLGGVPARVAVGFTSGYRDRGTHHWLVTDTDAHAWVEVWFPHYGWVRFDPTPAADPALGGHAPSLGTGALLYAPKSLGTVSVRHGGPGAAVKRRRRARAARTGAGGGFALAGPGLLVLALLGGVLVAGALLTTRSRSSAEALVAELDRALRRIGAPLPGGATLADVERRVAGSADASAYVRSLRLARFGDTIVLPTVTQRRALRRQLRHGLGILGPFRAWWALPPRWAAPGWASGQHRAPTVNPRR